MDQFYFTICRKKNDLQKWFVTINGVRVLLKSN